MSRGRHRTLFSATILLILAFSLGTSTTAARSAAAKQKSFDEWRLITSHAEHPPRVFVRANKAEIYFESESNSVAFSARWSRLRVPTDGYRVHSSLLRLDRDLSEPPQTGRGWREARVIAGKEWHELTTELIASLTPASAGHGSYYQGLLADRLLYRDADGKAHSAAADHPVTGLVVEKHFTMDETLQIVARLVEEQLARKYPGDSLFFLMAPDGRRFPQPLLLDFKQRQCVWLAPAALYDRTERGISLAVTLQGFEAMLFESHGLALLKNPISSAARLGDLGVESVARFVRFPFPKPGSEPPSVMHRQGMDLSQWEQWLDHYTGTRQEAGTIRLLVDGERFFPRLNEAISNATNHIDLDVFIFDKDDVAVEMADRLKKRSSEVRVRIILDRMGSLAAGMAAGATPWPEDFEAPSSILSCLRQDSKVRVRPFLNPWFSSDHSKVYLVDGTWAWVGGMNIGREYRYEWHDLMVELTGPVVTSLEQQFRRQWAHEGPLGDGAYLAAALSQRKEAQQSFGADQWVPIRLIPTKTAWKPFSAAIQGALRKAQNYIYVENPYLFDKRVIVGLVRARNRGVDVRVVLPRVNDFKFGGRSNLIVANYLLEHGVRVYFYPGMTHVKAFLADGWACLGSGNLNHLSLRLCQENNIATSDPKFVGQVKSELFEEDFARSSELTRTLTVGWSDFLADLMLEGF